MPNKFHFLCGNDGKRLFVYAIKLAQSPFYYFEELDSIISAHVELPAELKSVVTSNLQIVEITLNNEQQINYYKNGKFVFRSKELKTYVTLATESHQTKDLKFTAGLTNPIIFLAEFDKHFSALIDQEKTCTIRQFIEEEHEDEFNNFCYTDNWETVKKAFIKTFALKFIKNQKKDMNIEFKTESHLRNFIDRKLSAFEKYTTITFSNQMEMILKDLPSEIAKLFFVNGKLQCNKTQILDFCDSIQDSVQLMLQDRLPEPALILPQDHVSNANTGRSDETKLMLEVDEAMEIEVSTNEVKARNPKSIRAERGHLRRSSRVLKGKVVKPEKR